MIKVSLYNTLFGENEEAPVLLGMLALSREYFDRFRDIYLFNYGKSIRVYTRLGGGNRQEYKETWDKIRKHPNYIKDFDDEFDETYAYIDYSVPEKYIFTAKKMFIEEPYTVSERFHKEIEDMNKPGTDAYKRAEEISKKFLDALSGDGNIHFIEF